MDHAKQVAILHELMTHIEVGSEKAIGDAALKRLKAVIIEEDFVVAEKSQAALWSGLITEVAYGRNEPALHHYHRTFEEALAQPV